MCSLFSQSPKNSCGDKQDITLRTFTRDILTKIFSKYLNFLLGLIALKAIYMRRPFIVACAVQIIFTQ